MKLKVLGIRKVDISKLHLGKFTPRLPGRDYVRQHLEEITNSMREHGQWSEILVNKHLDVINGETRVMAAKRLGWSQIEAKVLDVTDDEAHLIALSSNVLQRNLDPIEEAEAIKYLHDRGFSVRKIAEKVGKGKSWVDERLQMARKLHPSIKLKLSTERTRITPKHAYYLAQVPTRDQLRIAEAIEREHLDVEATREEVEVALIHRSVVPTSSEPAEEPATTVTPEKPTPTNEFADLEKFHLFKDFSYSAKGVCPNAEDKVNCPECSKELLLGDLCKKTVRLKNPKLVIQAFKEHIVEALRKDLEELS